MKSALSRIAAVVAVLGLGAVPVKAQNADTALVNGKILTLDQGGSLAEALAVRDGKIIAVGRSADIRALAGPATRIVDLGGRTVIPGLIDSHMHAIRAALFYATEVNWIGTRSIREAMARIAAAAKAAKPGQWIIVAGGWTEQQFTERRRPTQAELTAAAPDHPVYIQSFYSAVLLSPAGFKTLGIAADADVPPRGKIERDGAGNPTGWIAGDNPTITALFDRLPLPSFDDSVAGTRGFFRELNRLGLTGVSDPGGFNLTAPSYLPLFKVWQDHDLTIRVVFSVFAQRPGKELEDYQNLTQMLPMGFGDDMLRFNGIGENVTWGMYNNDNPSEAQKQQYYEVARWAASRGMSLTQHWSNNVSVHHLLEVMERVNREMPIAKLRWSIAHLNDASAENLQRMKSLGVGWLMQDAMYFNGEAFIKARGLDTARRTPPLTDRREYRRLRRRRDRRPPGDVLQSVRRAAMDGRRQDHRGHRDPRPRRIADAGGSAAALYPGQRLVHPRRPKARRADARPARRPRGAVEGLCERPVRRDRRDRELAHHGRRAHRLRQRPICRARGQADELNEMVSLPRVRRKRGGDRVVFGRFS